MNSFLSRAGFLLTAVLTTAALPAAPACFVYVGTYTDWELFGPPRRNPPGARSQGIYVARFDPATGKLSAPELAATADNPTYVTLAPSQKILYATNEVYRLKGADTGAVSAFSIDAATGKLSFINQVAALGTGTCHASVDSAGRRLFVANFGSGSVAAFPLNADGSIRPATDTFQDRGSGPNPRQATPHAHAFNVTPEGKYAFASEFSSDRLLGFRIDEEGKFAGSPVETKLAPASAPRHLAFHPSAPFAYSVNEIDSTVTALRYDAAHGTLSVLETLSALPADFSGRNTSAEIVVHPSGKFLYASNRGHHSIAVFAIAADGHLRLIGHAPSGGRTPRGFSVDPTGRWLIAANQDTHNLAVFAIDQATGLPKATGQSEEVRTPVCVKFLTVADEVRSQF